MRIYKEFNINDFEPWCGATGTYNRIDEENKLDELQEMIEELYPDGIEETELNDLLWFDDEWVFETLGIEEEEEEEETV